MSKSIITKAKFKEWLAKQPDEREWYFFDNHQCVVCSFIKETTGIKVSAGGHTYSVGRDSRPLPFWLHARLAGMETYITGAALKKEFGV